MSDGSESVVVVSSKLAVRISNDPWRLVVSDSAGNPVLEESSQDRVVGPGGLGFQAGDDAPSRRWRKGPFRQPPGPDNEVPPGTGGWWLAKRTSKERSPTPSSYEAYLETDDPSGRHMSFSIELLDESVLSVRAAVIGTTEDVEAVGHAYRALEPERFLGFGERSHAVSVDRGVIENYVGEGPYQPHEYPLLETTVPPWGMRQRLDASYFPVPWILSTRGFGICIDGRLDWMFDITSGRCRTWDLSAFLGDAGVPSRVTADVEPLSPSTWTYDGAARVFKSQLTGTAIRLRVEFT